MAGRLGLTRLLISNYFLHQGSGRAIRFFVAEDRDQIQNPRSHILVLRPPLESKTTEEAFAECMDYIFGSRQHLVNTKQNKQQIFCSTDSKCLVFREALQDQTFWKLCFQIRMFYTRIKCYLPVWPVVQHPAALSGLPKCPSFTKRKLHGWGGIDGEERH